MGDTNLKGDAKRDALVSRYGEGGFDYVGNDWPDMGIWQSSARAHVVSRSKPLINQVRSHGNLGRLFEDGKPPLSTALFTAMRPHRGRRICLSSFPYWRLTAMVIAQAYFKHYWPS
ncbi:hypothetical protein [Candidatus Aalborgicola defluviihabitans]|uniref:hypothetical protein n=1 Tax=Candidatus Aalborgicola defluviihabitans TaxID=3386187 RepID=UPI0039B96E71